MRQREVEREIGVTEREKGGREEGRERERERKRDRESETNRVSDREIKK